MIDFLFTTALAVSHIFPSDFSVTAMNSNLLMSHASQSLPISVTATVVEAYETKTPPPGSQGVYPVGQAVVRLRLENLSQQSAQLMVERIQITPAHTQQTLMEQSFGTVELGGLQIQESGCRLTNEQGFLGHQDIHAVVTYRYQGKTSTVTSLPLKITMLP